MIARFAGVIAIALLLTSEACNRSEIRANSERLISSFTTNKLVILDKLRKKDFAGLDEEFEQYQRTFEKNPASELNEKLAFDSFATDDSSVRDLIAAWIKQRPDSFAAHMAMGSYYSWRGWHARGPAVASRTPSEHFDTMRAFLADSVNDTSAAIKIRPTLSIGYAILIGVARAKQNGSRLSELQAESLRRVPASFVVREQLMVSLYPRWGGNHELMAEFAEQSQAFAPQNPCMHWLLGFVDSDEGETLGMHGDYDSSIAALTRAIHAGGDYSQFYFIRGVSYALKKSYGDALLNFDRANELFPQDPETLIRRAYVLAALGRPTPALADLNFVKIFEQPDNQWTELHDWAVRASAKGQR